MAKKKLDFIEQKDWQNIVKNRTPENMPRLSEFIAFLTERSHSIKILEKNKAKTVEKKANSEIKKKEKKVALVSATIKCRTCEGDHPTYKCSNFLSLSTADRKKKLLEKRLCINCLGAGHYARYCQSSTCKKCGKKHNSLIHEDAPEQDGVKDKSLSVDSAAPVSMNCAEAKQRQQQFSNGEANTATSTYYAKSGSTTVVLSTARVCVLGADDRKQQCRALLDPGSQLNLVTLDLARRLKLPCNKEVRQISGINKIGTTANETTRIRIKSRCNDFTTMAECLVVPEITEQLPQVKIDATRICIPKGVELADPTYYKPGPVDLLLGAGIYWQVVVGAPTNKKQGRPALQNTHLGTIIGGELNEESKNLLKNCNIVTNVQLQEQLQRFWAQEEIPKPRPYSKEEMQCERLFFDTTERKGDGRFVICLPTRSHVKMGDSLQQATQRLTSLERRFARDPVVKEAYCKFMEEYQQQGYMSIVEDKDIALAQEHCIIPHLPVL
ncbi:PREDICTED: uncharacterized protein LOC108774125 [Cyphomyrmex costatus]|uniref:uncharacterized protein LOC108774125 n=1 Tax=Cyphomyrmex costatus TaxID=456900 RepID=UPI000852246F|nr:PREDICTED: uncharacterized protein LOC108774125 [Cyphomyrmex costatus]